jgi:hypothetical protein
MIWWVFLAYALVELSKVPLTDPTNFFNGGTPPFGKILECVKFLPNSAKRSKMILSMTSAVCVAYRALQELVEDVLPGSMPSFSLASK